jgi:hypothetical protein
MSNLISLVYVVGFLRSNVCHDTFMDQRIVAASGTNGYYLEVANKTEWLVNQETLLIILNSKAF